jgi:hypothetical protein
MDGQPVVVELLVGEARLAFVKAQEAQHRKILSTFLVARPGTIKAKSVLGDSGGPVKSCHACRNVKPLPYRPFAARQRNAQTIHLRAGAKPDDSL